MIRFAILGIGLVFLASLVTFAIHKVSSMARAVGAWAKGAPVPPPPAPGKMLTLDASIARIAALRPRETGDLVRALEGFLSDLRHAGTADGSAWEAEAHVMADVVDPVLAMIERLHRRDRMPREALDALAAAEGRVQRMVEERSRSRIAAASGEAKGILERLNTKA